MQPTLSGFWVSLYFIYDGTHCYVFYNQSEWMDNCMLMSECGSVHSFVKEVLVTPTAFSSIYREICDIENVS